MTSSRYRTIAIVALVFLCLIVVTGASVRLSGSGLGCSDWPRCNDEKFIDVTTTHGAIEQINRLFTFVVGAAVIAAVLGAFKRRPKRRDLVRLSIWIAVGVPMQGVVGAIVVWTDLNPFANQQHFLLSMVLVALATMLVVRAGEHEASDGTVVRRQRVSDGIRTHVWAVTVATGLALLSGTFVTGAGPHAGDEDAKRFAVAISTVARIHGIVVIVTVVLALVLMWRLRNRRADRDALDAPLTTWLVMALAQAAIGYIQYFNGVPAVLVGIHIALATGLWMATVRLQLSTLESVPADIEDSTGDEPALTAH